MNAEVYEAIATALTYPDHGYSGHIKRACELALPTECHDDIAKCVADISELGLTAQQELFTQTFDLNPVCSLELGWHLFGENYERGLLLVRLREELRAAGIAENGELPDHLTYALRLLPRMEHQRAEDFVCAIVLPAVVKMMQAICGKGNPYEHLLRALTAQFLVDFPEIPLPTTKVELPIVAEEVTG